MGYRRRSWITLALVVVVGLLAASPALAASLMWGDLGTGAILLLDLDSNQIQTFLPGGGADPQDPWAVAVDSGNKSVYWTEFSRDNTTKGGISRSNVDGSGIIHVLTPADDPSSPSGLALDLVNGKMYWTDTASVDSPIRSANLDGSNVSVVAEAALATAIALDVAGGKVYWTNWADGTVRRANLDGSNPQTLSGPNLDALTNGIALDLVNSRMYWVETGRDVIRRAKLDGTQKADVLTIESPVAITLDVDNGKIYGSYYAGTGKIFSANLDGTNVQTIASGLDFAPYALTLIGDIFPPQTVIDSGPPASTKDTDTSFTFHAEADSVFECKLDDQDFGPCTSPAAVTVAEGPHVFQVRATDPAGNTDPTPAQYNWTVDQTPPTTKITAGPTGSITVPNAAFTWSGTDNVTPTSGLTYAVRLHPIEPNFSAFGSATSQSYNGLPNGQYTLFVKAMDAAGNVDPSPASRAFTVAVPPGIKVITPNGGESFVAGSQQTISWVWNGVPGTLVKITLLKNGVFNSNIAATAPLGAGGAGSFQWTIPGTQVGGTDYKVKIVSVSNGTISDSSDANFTIVGLPPSITVVSPNGGEQLDVGKQVTIRWSLTGNPGATVKINLLKGGVLNKTIGSSVPIGTGGVGSFNWTPPAAQAPGADYQIQVITNTSLQDTSDAPFTIRGSQITVVSPNGGEVVAPGSKLLIRWSFTGSPGTTVKIVLNKGGVFNRNVVFSTPIGTAGAGSFDWTVPATQTPGTDYRIAVISNANSVFQDKSDSDFTIGP